MESLENEIIAWNKETFPNATMKAKQKKLVEECKELLAALIYGNLQGALEEVADIFIVAVSIAADREHFENNVSMSRVIADKLKVNRARQWGEENENGDRPRVK